MHHILGTGNIDLTVVRQQPGRPALTVPSKRGWSSAALYWSGQAAKEAKRRATGYQPSAPSSVQPGSFAANLSDAAAARCSLTAVQDASDASGTPNLSAVSAAPCAVTAAAAHEASHASGVDASAQEQSQPAVEQDRGSSTWRAKGPNVHFTNFSIVRAVLHGRCLRVFLSIPTSTSTSKAMALACLSFRCTSSAIPFSLYLLPSCQDAATLCWFPSFPFHVCRCQRCA